MKRVRSGLMIKYIAVLGMLMISLNVMAGDDDPPPPPDGDPGAPLDGGVSILLAAGISYGAKRAYDMKKGKEAEEKK